MFKFKFLLWAFAQMLKRQIRNNPDCARYVGAKSLVFQIRTVSGAGRTFVIEEGAIRSSAGLTANPRFTQLQGRRERLCDPVGQGQPGGLPQGPGQQGLDHQRRLP
jgi:hypothetical protein